MAQLSIMTTTPIAAQANVSFACRIRSEFPPEVNIMMPPQINMSVARTAIMPKTYRTTWLIKHVAVLQLIGFGRLIKLDWACA